jgi:hypothetical protein
MLAYASSAHLDVRSVIPAREKGPERPSTLRALKQHIGALRSAAATELPPQARATSITIREFLVILYAYQV